MNQINSRQLSRTAFVRNVLSTCCAIALTATAGAAVSADMATSPFGSKNNSGNALSAHLSQEPRIGDLLGDEYPDTETMLNMYHTAVEQGLLEKSMAMKHPSMPVLKSAYKYLGELAANEIGRQWQTQDHILPPLHTKQSSDCRVATLQCLVASATFGYNGFSEEEKARLFVCSMAAAGRNQDNPLIDENCVGIMDGAESCANANAVCGVVASPNILGSTFVGNSANSTSVTITCGNIAGGSPKDRAIRLGTEFTTIGGVKRITALFLGCSQIAGKWVGVSQQGTQEILRCPLSDTKKTAIEGAKVTAMNVGGLRSIKLRCDDVTTADPTKDSYTGVMANSSTAGTEGSVECKEGQYVWGIRAFVNTNAPAAQQYITGYNYICR